MCYIVHEAITSLQWCPLDNVRWIFDDKVGVCLVLCWCDFCVHPTHTCTRTVMNNWWLSCKQARSKSLTPHTTILACVALIHVHTSFSDNCWYAILSTITAFTTSFSILGAAGYQRNIRATFLSCPQRGRVSACVHPATSHVHLFGTMNGLFCFGFFYQPWGTILVSTQAHLV